MKDAPVVESMKRLAKQYPRYGYRRIRIFLAREGHEMSADRAGRLWRKARLQLPAKRPRRRPAQSIARAPAPTSANRVWALSFLTVIKPFDFHRIQATEVRQAWVRFSP